MNPQDLPHDVYGLVPYQPPIWGYVVAGLLGLIALLVCYLIWKKFRGSKKDKPMPSRDPLKECLNLLRSLEPVEPFSRKEQINFFYKLSLLFREYLELTLKIPATDSTSRELVQHFNRVFIVDRETKEAFLRFFESSDMVKFAEKEVSVKTAEEQKFEVLEWVDKLERLRIQREAAKPQKPSSEGVAYEV